MKIKVWIEAPKERKIEVDEEEWSGMSEKERDEYIWETIRCEGLIRYGWEEA